MPEFVYLDNAATTFPKPPEVIRFACDFYLAKGVNPGRTGFDLALEAEETLAAARQAHVVLSTPYVWRYHPVARQMKEFVADGILGSATPKGPVALRFPLHTVEILFRRLFPEA